jgi:hypothetical protein
MPSFNIMLWPEGTQERTWTPVAQAVDAPSMREAVEKSAKGPGRYRATLADEPGMTGGGLVRVDPDGSAHDVDVF